MFRILLFSFIVLAVAVLWSQKIEDTPQNEEQRLCIQIGNVRAETVESIPILVLFEPVSNLSQLHKSYESVLLVGQRYGRQRLPPNAHLLDDSSFVTRGCLFIGSELWSYEDSRHVGAVSSIIDMLDMNIDYSCVIILTQMAPYITGESTVAHTYNHYARDLSGLLTANADVLKLWAYASTKSSDRYHGNVRISGGSHNILCV